MTRITDVALGQTPSQTVGPFFHFALPLYASPVLVTDKTKGERIRIEGRVIDGDGKPLSDALIEIWQANAEGRYDHPEDKQDKPIDPEFHGFGRSATDNDGRYSFQTIRPGAVPGPGNTLQAPHVNVTVFARGMLKQLVTRLYFEDEKLNADDPILARIPDALRRSTLIARRKNGKDAPFVFDIVLQGKDETVFFDV
jgi:protocatechuate 3,4-dioxygenase alpha subunit